MLHAISGKYTNVTIVQSHCQVFFATGGIVAVVQLVILPELMKVLGITYLQRIAGVAGVLAFASVPFATVLSWDEISLYVVSVASAAFVYCNAAAVRWLMAQTGNVLLKHCWGCGRARGWRR